MDANNVRNMWNIIAVTNKHTAKLHHVGSSYILTYDAEAIDLGRPYWILHPVSCQTPEAVTTVFKCS
jgi:hypothetical protein